MALPAGIMPASVHIENCRVIALAGYDEVPREACPEELGKSIIMPALAPLPAEELEPIEERITLLASRLAESWTRMRDEGSPIEQLIETLCRGQMQVGSRADFFVWNPELVVIGSKPVRYGQLRQIILDGHCIYKDGMHLGG